jgi:hypothetical protein
MSNSRVKARAWAARWSLPLLLASSVGQAAPITFNFTGPIANLGNTETFAGSLGGTSVDAQAYARRNDSTPTGWQATNPLSTGSSIDLRRTTAGEGLGVSRVGSTNNSAGQFDSMNNLLEGVLFDFGSLDLGSIRILFGAAVAADDAVLYWGDIFNPSNGAAPLTNSVAVSFTGASGGDFAYDLATFGGARYLFVTSADDASTGAGACTNVQATNSNCFRVDGIEGTKAQAIPEPDTLGLLGLAAAGIAVGSIRRRKA